MGLFSNKKKVEVSVVVSRAIEDRMIPDTTLASTTKAILNNGVISEYLADGWMGSIGTRANRMYHYAKKWHPYGMPVSNLHSSLDGQAIVKKVIETELGRPMKVVYFKLAPFNATHHAWQTLVNQYGYNSTTNQIAVLSKQQGVPVYLKNIIPLYTLEDLEDSPQGSQDVWGLPASAYPYPGRMATPASLAEPTAVEIDPTGSHSIVRVLYVFQVEITQTVGNMQVTIPEWREGYLDLSLEEYSLDSEWYQVGLADPTNNQMLYWRYRLESNVYPELEGLQDAAFNELGTYFPITYFRYDFTPETTARQEYSDAYEDQKKMLKYINMDYDAVGDAINANPGIENIVHSFMMFGVAPGSSDPVDQKYLYEYFNDLWYATGAKNPTFDPLIPAASDRRFSITDKRFTMSFGYKSLVKRSMGGTVAKVGQYTGSYSNKVYTYRYQRTTAVYDEVEVHGLLLNYKVYKGYGYTGNAGSKALLIPLDKAMLSRFSAAEKEILIARSMHYCMCSYIETEVKWYSQGWFKIVIIIIAIVIIVLTWGGGSGFATALVAGAYATAALILIQFIVYQVVMSMIMSAVFSLVAKALGAEAAMIIGAIMIIYGVGSGMVGSEGLLGITPTQIVGAGTGLVNAANNSIQAEIKQIQGEMTEFSLIADQKWAELEEVKNLLGKENILDPFEFIGKEPKIIFGEPPDDFYTRTIHAGNIGVIGIDMISSFADVSLTLPKLPQNIGDTDNELA